MPVKSKKVTRVGALGRPTRKDNFGRRFLTSCPLQAETSLGWDKNLFSETDMSAFAAERGIKDEKGAGVNLGRTITFAGSTNHKDRYTDRIDQSGWFLDHYRSNPVFLWAHDYSEHPHGSSLHEYVVTDEKSGVQQLMFTIAFAERSIHTAADTTFKLYKAGHMKATSVGFMALEIADIEDEAQRAELDVGENGFYFLRQELLELSAAPVPANPYALMNDLKTDFGKKVFDPTDAAVIFRMLSPNRQLQIRYTELCEELGLFANKEARRMMEVHKRALQIVRDNAPPPASRSTNADEVQKSGAVLSKKNRSRIEDAVRSLSEVLDDAAPQSDEGEGNDSSPLDTTSEGIDVSEMVREIRQTNTLLARLLGKSGSSDATPGASRLKGQSHGNYGHALLHGQEPQGTPRRSARTAPQIPPAALKHLEGALAALREAR